MVKIAEATRRMFHNVFVCKKCKSKLRTDRNRIKKGIVKCRKCGSKALRAKNAKK